MRVRRSLYLVLAVIAGFSSMAEGATFETYSQPRFKFSISIPEGWATDVKDSAEGRSFTFHDRKGSAFSISVTKPTESKLRLSKRINGKGYTESELRQLEKMFERETGYKEDVVLSIETVSNKKAFAQMYFYSHNTLGSVWYIKNYSFEVVHNSNVYLISFSGAAARTKRDASLNFNTAVNKYFAKMLESVVLFE